MFEVEKTVQSTYINSLSLIHVHSAVTYALLRLRLARIGMLFGSQNAIHVFMKHKYTLECQLIMFRIRLSVRYAMYANIQL